MGILRLMGTILKHPATKDALSENIPLIECLMIDYNANIHYILQKTITELNEILFFTYNRESKLKNMLTPHILEPNEYSIDSKLSFEELEDMVDKYDEDYQLGTSYLEIKEKMSEEKINDIIFNETIKYTRILICSLNKGWIKKVYLALDGTPSMAKIKEQRNRRYIGALLNNIKEDIVKKYKFKNNNVHQIDLFYYRSLICTGTKFMEKIQQALFHLDIDLDIEVSTMNTKGEGEKKIIHAMEMDTFSSYNNFCIMSPDSDMLILIGLLCNNKKFIGKKIYNFRIDYQRKNQYQFFDLNQLIDNFRKYFSIKIKHEISNSHMLDLFFMLVVFGNDFLPKLEPLDIIHHFDFVCESCLKISTSGLQFTNNNNINYLYLINFFKLINNDIVKMSIEHSLNDKYNNYHKLCKNISITEEDLQEPCHNKLLRPFIVNYNNFNVCIKILNSSYTKLLNYLKEIIIKKNDIQILYKEIHSNPNDSYLLLVFPRILKFAGSENSTNKYTFFENFIEHTNVLNNFSELKFRNKLMLRQYNLQMNDKENNSLYITEIEKLNKSMEPYRSIFRISSINLVTFDIQNSQIIDLRDKYYETYIKNNITKKEIEQLVMDYLVGIEWLYQYYVNGKHLEWSGWYYNHSQPPLIDDIIKFLENQSGYCEQLENILNSYPENNMSPSEHYLYVTPNEYTNANVAPNLSDILHLIDGNGAIYLNKCQIKWHEYEKNN